MNNENIVYVKIKNGIFKCYKSEQMHKPIYYPVESKTNGYIDYNDVEKILTIEDLYQENQLLKKQLEELDRKLFFTKNELDMRQKSIDNKLNQQKEFIKYLENEINKLKEQIKNYDIWHEVGNDINFLILKKQFNIEILSKYKEIIGVSDENN